MTKKLPRIVSGQIVSLTDDPSRFGKKSVKHYESGSIVISTDGKIEWIGEKCLLPRSYETLHNENTENLILPGFVDAHCHYPQYKIIGSYGSDLLEWLQIFTFPEEAKFSDESYAFNIAKLFANELAINGVTSAGVYSTNHEDALSAIMEAGKIRGLHFVAGITSMNRNVPSSLHISVKQLEKLNKKFLEMAKNSFRSKFSITPRFAITSTPEILEYSGEFLKNNECVVMQTHLNENEDEISLTKKLFPTAKNYLDVYDQFGLVTERSLFAHSIFSSEDEINRLEEAKSSIIHCPTSNTFLGSGLFDYEKYIHRCINIALGSDVGGGTSFSPFATMGEAYKVAKLISKPVSAFQTLYWHTLGAAKALKLENEIGSLEIGKWADILIIDPECDPLSKARWNNTSEIEDKIFGLLFLLPERKSSIKTRLFAGEEYSQFPS